MRRGIYNPLSREASRENCKGGESLEAPVGTVFGGRYEVTGTLGTGGMAVVYKAQDAILGRTVALKTLRQHYAEEKAFQRRFRQEARAMASLDHPKILRVYDISQEGDAPFIVAECIEGEDVGSRLSRVGRMDVRAALSIVEQLLEALSYAHARGIIHRDIKPSNVMLSGESIKVADFGIARIVEETRDDERETGEVIGSARYMSPEQLMGRRATPRSDIYSVGILLYHLLTGEPPFSGDTRSVARQQLHREPLPPRRLNRKIPSHLEAVILRSLCKDPSERFPSAEAMLKEIRRQRSGRNGSALLGHFFGGRRRSLTTATVVAVLLSGLMAAGISGYIGDGDLASSRSSQGNSPAATVQESIANSVLGGSGEESEEGETAQTTASSESVRVPSVDAYYDYYAADVLASRGFETEIVYEYREGYSNRGVTWKTEPSAGEMAPEGSTVTIYATPKDQPQPQF